MSKATPKQAIERIENDFSFLIEEIGNDQRLIWLGSAISKRVFPDLKSLLQEAIERLQAKADFSDACPYKRALDDIQSLVEVLDDQLDFEKPIADWNSNVKATVLKQLLTNYSKVLDINVPEGTLGYDLLCLPAVYADEHKHPDAEHIFLAMLIEEVSSKLVTTNWECLIEAAHIQISRPKSPGLLVIASSSDILNSGGSDRVLFKIHGCAKKCTENDDTYREYMVATEPEIVAFGMVPRFEPIRTNIINTLREYPSLFIGLSAQDFNLKVVLAKQAEVVEEVPFEPPRILFTSNIGSDQKTVLKCVYGTAAYQPNREQIDNEACCPCMQSLCWVRFISWFFEENFRY